MVVSIFLLNFASSNLNNNIMTKLEEVLFTNGDLSEKVSFINDMVVSELMEVKKPLVKSIVEKCGENGTLWIDRKRRVENGWNSSVDNVSVYNGDVYVEIYVQDAHTDTSMSEEFNKFFRKGEYFSRDNRLNVGVDYKEGQKAEVMRSILLECVYQQFCDEVQREKIVSKLSHYSIINPVLDYFYRKWDLWHRQISRYSSNEDIIKNKAYHNGEKKIKEYIKENAEQLIGKTNEELQDIYKKVFLDSYEEFKKNFNVAEWRRTNQLWY